MTEVEIIRTTQSLCPECLKQITAEFYVDPETQWVMLRKHCEEHGEFKDKISISVEDYKWQKEFTKEMGSTIEISTQPCSTLSGIKKTENGCPYDCGICENHKSAPCICLIDVTNRCNLTCPICFANASAKGYVVQPTFDQIIQIMTHFRSMEPTPAVLLQFAGGEPTLRDDLPEIIRRGKKMGFIETMVSTNGVRMGKSIEYCRELKEAGLDAVYLQFDATDSPETWKKIRGVNLWPLKKKVIENCRKVGLNGVVLVPTLAKGVNDHQIGPILDFAKDNTDVVVGVVFQPVSLCGRINYEELMDLRYTTSDLKVAINQHTNNAVTHFYPIATTAKFTQLLAWFDDVPAFSMVSHHDCGFATICVVNDKDEWEPIENYFDANGLIKWANKVYDMVVNKETPRPTKMLNVDLSKYGSVLGTIGNFIDDMTNLGYRQMMKAYFVAGLMRYIRNPSKIITSKTFQSFAKLVFSPNLQTAGGFLKTKNLLISAMHFQDAYNFDLERVKSCLVHYGVIDPDDPNKVLEIPFCAMNTVHREKIERKLALVGEQAKKPEVIQSEIESILENLE